MSRYWENGSSGGCATLSRDPNDLKRRGLRLMVAGCVPFATRVAEHFRRQGWHVQVPANAADIRGQKSQVVVLPAEFGAESGYLLCAKLIASNPRLKVVIVGSDDTGKARNYARFVGASAYVGAHDGLERTLDVIAALAAK